MAKAKRPVSMIQENEDMIKHYSFSSLNKWEMCKRSWELEYIQQRRTPPSAAASFGSQFDQIVADKLGLEAEVPEDPVEGVVEAADFYLSQPGAWTQADEAQTKIEITPDQFDYIAEQLDLSVQGIPIPIVGYLDLIRRQRGQVEILDLKTSTRKEFRLGWAKQVFGIYTLATQGTKAEVHLITRLARGLGFHRYEFRPTRETWKWIMRWLDETINEIEKFRSGGAAEELHREPGYYCRWCPEEFQCTAALFNQVVAR